MDRPVALSHSSWRNRRWPAQDASSASSWALRVDLALGSCSADLRAGRTEGLDEPGCFRDVFESRRYAGRYGADGSDRGSRLGARAAAVPMRCRSREGGATSVLPDHPLPSLDPLGKTRRSSTRAGSSRTRVTWPSSSPRSTNCRITDEGGARSGSSRSAGRSRATSPRPQPDHPEHRAAEHSSHYGSSSRSGSPLRSSSLVWAGIACRPGSLRRRHEARRPQCRM